MLSFAENVQIPPSVNAAEKKKLDVTLKMPSHLDIYWPSALDFSQCGITAVRKNISFFDMTVALSHILKLESVSFPVL